MVENSQLIFYQNFGSQTKFLIIIVIILNLTMFMFIFTFIYHQKHSQLIIFISLINFFFIQLL